MTRARSRQDIANAKEAIKSLETQLAEALKVLQQVQLHVTNLQRELQERKTWISPIRKVPFDVLSLIFASSGEVDWKSPLRIGGVNRYFRAVVLATPQAWCFIDMRRNCAFGCMELYFERSGQRLLHIGIRHPAHLEHFTTKMTSRIQCMAIPSLPDEEDTEEMCFPRLHSLRVPMTIDWTQSLNVAQITTSSFPALVHLNIKNTFTGTSHCPEFPPLQTLAINAGRHESWYEIPRKCSLTLLSLEITVTSFFPTESQRIYEVRFPRLTYLKAINENEEEHPWRLNLVTPALITYIEETGWGAYRHALHEDTASVVYMELNRLPLIPQSKQLRFLRLRIPLDDSRQLLHDLEANASDYPSLEFLEFGWGYMEKPEAAELVEILEDWDVGTRPGLKKPTVALAGEWSMEFHGGVEAECGDDMTCGAW